VENEAWCNIFAVNSNNIMYGKEIDMTKTTDLEQITKFLNDPIIVRIVGILDITSLSILELLEYDLTRNDINHALSNGVIKIDKSASSASAYEHDNKRNMLVSGDYYFYNFLNSKIKLTEMGLQILESIKGE
jgi:DNA-binding transcriptional ArsR family regulator